MLEDHYYNTVFQLIDCYNYSTTDRETILKNIDYNINQYESISSRDESNKIVIKKITYVMHEQKIAFVEVKTIIKFKE